ncbi:hypothetical protein Tco_1061750, partial [Tanacetum coccineum]
LSFDLNVRKDSSYTDEVAQNGGNPKPVTFEIHHGGCFTPTPSRSYVGGQVSSVNVVDIEELYLHDLKDMVVKSGYGVADLMYYYFLRVRLCLDYGMHPLNVDDDVLEMAKYVKDNKIILVYVEHKSSNVYSSIFVTPKKRVAIAADNHLRKISIEIDSSPGVNRNLTPMCHRNLTKEWERPASFVEGPIIVESNDPFDGLDEILGDYANTKEEITGEDIIREEIIGKQMIVHVEVEVDADNESEEESDIEENDISGSDSEDLDYDPKHDEVFDDDEHILEDVPVSMNNFNFNPDPKHDLSIAVVEVHKADLDVIDYDSFGSDLDDGIDSDRRTQLRELRRIGKAKNQGLNKNYFYLGQQFATKEIVKGIVKKHYVETRRKLILVKMIKKGRELDVKGQFQPWSSLLTVILLWVKMYFHKPKMVQSLERTTLVASRIFFGKDKTIQGNSKKVNEQKKKDKYSCPWTMLIAYINEGRWEVRILIKDHKCLQSREIKACTSRFLLDHVIKTLATNLDIPMRVVQDQMQKQFDVRISKMKAFRAKRIASDKMTSNFKEHYSMLREYDQELINQNPGTSVRIDVQQEPNPESPTRTFRMLYVCLGALKQGFRACDREILGLDGCFMSGPFLGQIL